MNIIKFYRYAAKAIEFLLALIILTSVVIFLFRRVTLYDVAGIGSTVSIEKLISDALLMVLGLELVRLLITPSIKATLELMIFVVARKTLTPSISSMDLLLNVIAFSLLILVNHTCIHGEMGSKIKEMLSFNGDGDIKPKKELK